MFELMSTDGNTVSDFSRFTTPLHENTFNLTPQTLKSVKKIDMYYGAEKKTPRQILYPNTKKRFYSSILLFHTVFNWMKR
jgi:hypothetical protein